MASFDITVEGIADVEKILKFSQQYAGRVRQIIGQVNDVNITRKIQGQVRDLLKRRGISLSGATQKLLEGYTAKTIIRDKNQLFIEFFHEWDKNDVVLSTRTANTGNSWDFTGSMYLNMLRYGRNEYRIPGPNHQTNPIHTLCVWTKNGKKQGFNYKNGKTARVPSYEGIDIAVRAMQVLEDWFDALEEKIKKVRNVK